MARSLARSVNAMELVAFPFWSLWLHSAAAAAAATTTSYEGLSVGASLASVPKQPSKQAGAPVSLT